MGVVSGGVGFHLAAGAVGFGDFHDVGSDIESESVYFSFLDSIIVGDALFGRLGHERGLCWLIHLCEITSAPH